MGSVGTAAAANALPVAAPRTNRKTYTVSKAREKWTDEEHAAFLTALEKRGESSAFELLYLASVERSKRAMADAASQHGI